MSASIEKITLNGSDWEAQHFISERDFAAWTGLGRHLDKMLLDDAQHSGFLFGEDDPSALHGTIPGCDRSFLMANGLMDDPYYARNLWHSSWAEDAAWAFRKRFVVPESWRGRRIVIDFSGIDYEAHFFFNKVYLGTHKGAFIPVTWDITEWVRFGEENWIALAFSPAPHGTPNHSVDDQPADFSRFHRTQIGFGWDWSRKFVPTGIWDDVSLIAYERARLRDWNVTHERNDVTVDLEIESRSDGALLPVAIELTPPDGGDAVILEQQTALNGGHNERSYVLHLSEVERWMPNGSGNPNLYGLRIFLDGSECVCTKVGFKNLVMRRNPDAPEDANPLLFEVNGQAVFVCGANWVPPDLMPSEVTAVDYEHLVAMAANAGINLFRMWGGGELEKAAFYEACDRHGILVWHEFFHACSNSPKDDSGYVAFKEREARSVLKRLRRHVCLSLVCGGNEMQYYGEIPDAPLLKMYERVSHELVPELPYHVSCPDKSRPGERHHGPWNFQPHSFYNSHFRLLASEYGCNSMPCYESLKRFLPKEEHGRFEGQTLQFHFLNPERTRKAYAFDAALARFNVTDMEQFCKATMLAQADVAQYMTEHYRRAFPASSGCVFWQYDEPWPTCAWSIVDYYGESKQALYGIRQAMSPILLSLEDEGWCLSDNRLAATWFLTVASEHATGETDEATLEAWTESGDLLFTKRCPVKLDSGTHALMTLDEAVPSGHVIVVRMRIEGRCNCIRLYGNPDFSSFFNGSGDVVIQALEGQRYSVANTGRSCALCVRLKELAGAPAEAGFFSEDYLTLLPGETRQVLFIPKGTIG